MNVEAGQIWTDEEDTYLIVSAPGRTFNALKISWEPSLLAPLTLLYTGAGVDEEVIKEELTLSKRNFVGVVTEMDEEDE